MTGLAPITRSISATATGSLSRNSATRADFDIDEERYAHLPLLEWQADMQRRYPRG
jgi:hypothetical protein